MPSPDDFFRGGLVFARRQLFSTFSELPGVTGLKHVKIDRDRAEAVVYFMSGDDAKLAASQVRHSLVACACTPLLTGVSEAQSCGEFSIHNTKCQVKYRGKTDRPGNALFSPLFSVGAAEG